jgi:hypothetical protein
MWTEQYHEHIQWRPVLAVVAIPCPPDSEWFSSITFYVEGYQLSLTPTVDTDEIAVTVSPAESMPIASQTNHPALLGVVGRTLGWFWRATNSQGYTDMLILAVDGEEIGAGVHPQIAFLVEGATIQLNQITPAAW